MSYPKLVKQKTPTTCGQCCIATLLCYDIETVIKSVGYDGIMSDQDMMDAWFWRSRSFVIGTPPEGTIAIQKHKDPNGDREHWTVFWGSVTLDPACIGPRLWPVYKYLVIDWMIE